MPDPSLSRGAGEELSIASPQQPLSRIAGEGAERSEAGEGLLVFCLPAIASLH